MRSQFIVTSPGRAVLCGEHQDYLGLPVISYALPYYQRINVEVLSAPRILFHSSVTGEDIEIPVESSRVPYFQQRDYVRSAWNVVQQAFPEHPSNGAAMISTTDFPVSSGLGSSSSFVTALIVAFLYLKGKEELNPGIIANLAYQAEILEFHEAGGMQDHLAASYGGVNYLEFSPRIRVGNLPFTLMGNLLIVNTGSIKENTVSDLKSLRSEIQTSIQKVREVLPKFDLQKTTVEEVSALGLEANVERVVCGVLKMRDLTRYLVTNLVSNEGMISSVLLGQLFFSQQDIVFNDFQIRSKQVSQTITDLASIGANGAKINGSGKGGAVIACFPKRHNVSNIAKILEDMGYSSFSLVFPGAGAQVSYL